MSKLKLDVKDQKLIEVLEEDSRASISQIARRIGVSKEVTNYRIKRLTDQGLIIGYSTLIDYHRLGYERYKFLINLMNYTPQLKKDILKFFKNKHLVDCKVLIQTEYDFEIIIWALNNNDARRVYDDFLEVYSDYLRDVSFFLITKKYLLRNAYIYGRQTVTVFESCSSLIKIDKQDRALLHFLESEPKIEIKSLAQKTKIPISTASYKIKQLEKAGIIKKVVPIIDASLLGYTKYHVYLYIKSPSDRANLINYICCLKNVVRVYELLGPVELSFEAYFKTAKEADDFLTKLKIDQPKITDTRVMIEL